MHATKTVIKKDHVTVVVVSCYKYIGDSLKLFQIEDTDQYFVTYPNAMKAAQELLIKLTISEKAFVQRKHNQARIRNAKKVIHVYNAVTETEAYIKRWYDILYLETKKALHAEMKEKLDEVCAKYGFANAHEAIGVIERELINKRKRYDCYS